MKLTEIDKRDCCEYVADQVCRSMYGDNYRELGIRFDLQRVPTSLRTIIEATFEWLRMHAKKNSD